MTDIDTPLVLVDGSSYLYRAFHALPPLATSGGQPTGAIKGVISMLRRLEKDYPGSNLVVVFDAKGKTFRDALFEQYKAHRPPMPEDLKSQIQPIHEIVRALGMPLLVIDGVEADDVIGTLAKDEARAGHPVVISTGDKDMAQLVNERISLVNTMTSTFLDRQGVIDKFGVPPELIIDFLALVGDKSDNIPGVPGVGEKSALAMLQGIGGLDSLYADLEAIRQLPFRGSRSMPEKLQEYRDQAYLSYRLATIKDDVAVGITRQDLQGSKPDTDKLTSLYRELEFKAWLEELLDANQEQPTVDNPGTGKSYDTVFTEGDLDRWIKVLNAAEVFAFDTETTSLDYMAAELVGVSFSATPHQAAYIPFGHDYLGAPAQLGRQRVLDKLKPMLENPKKAKLGQNLKYDMSVLARHGIELNGVAYDTMLESYLIDATGSRHDMDTLALKYLGEKTIRFEEIAGKGASQLTFNQVAIEQAAPYAAEDADVTLRLHQILWPKLAAEPGLRDVFETIEMPLVPVLSTIERNGALVDAGRLASQSRQLGQRIEELEREAYDLAGQEFNLSSPKQLAEILFDKLKIPVGKKTAKGAASTREEVLQDLALDYPLPRVLLEHRGLAKLKSTYTDKLPRMINPGTGRIHTSYHQAGTATGRLSSSDPNLQNIPVRSEEGRRIRQAFVAGEGCKILAADYSQIELRIMAHLSGDKGLCDAFSHGLDVHRATAAEVFDVALDQVSLEQRRNAKAINFGLIYGMSAFGLARQLRIGRTQAQQYIDQYFSRYPGVAAYMENTRTRAREMGYVETLFGRRLYLPQIKAANGMQRQAAERTAINAPMQGTAADIIKRAMIAVHHWLQAEGAQTRMIMQVHDELVFEVPRKEVAAVQDAVARLMSSSASLDVPLLVDIGVGNNWDEAH